MHTVELWAVDYSSLVGKLNSQPSECLLKQTEKQRQKGKDKKKAKGSQKEKAKATLRVIVFYICLLQWHKQIDENKMYPFYILFYICNYLFIYFLILARDKDKILHEIVLGGRLYHYIDYKSGRPQTLLQVGAPWGHDKEASKWTQGKTTGHVLRLCFCCTLNTYLVSL